MSAWTAARQWRRAKRARTLRIISEEHARTARELVHRVRDLEIERDQLRAENEELRRTRP